MRYIQLTQNKKTIVDDEDYNWLCKYKWHYAQGYARRAILGSDGKYHIKGMHHILCNTPKGMRTDHINGDMLDNRRANLRISTNQGNSANRDKYSNNKSGYKGVYWYEPAKRWRSNIRVNYKLIDLGYYRTKEEAALAYNKAASEHFGEYARLNTI